MYYTAGVHHGLFLKLHSEWCWFLHEDWNSPHPTPQQGARVVCNQGHATFLQTVSIRSMLMDLAETGRSVLRDPMIPAGQQWQGQAGQGKILCTFCIFCIFCHILQIFFILYIFQIYATPISNTQNCDMSVQCVFC
jgi:hypothetical protein